MTDTLRAVLSPPGALVPVAAVRRARWLVGRGLLLRLANDRLRRSPRPYAIAKTDVGVFVDGHTDDLIERFLYVFGTWEPSLSAYLAAQLRPGDVFVDLGANVGYFTLLAARAVTDAGHVVAFEPMPPTIAKLRRNIEANGLANVAVVPCAASDVAGRVELFSGPTTNVGRSSTMPIPDGHSAGDVERVVAADAIPVELWPRVRAIKVDVEGDELSVVRGLAPVLDALHPGSSVVVEVAPDRLAERGHAAVDLFDEMSARGFSAAALSNVYHPSYYVDPVIAAPVPVTDVPVGITDLVFTKRR